MTRVLFVDDEPRVLEGLRNSLRSKRKLWEMVFVENGQAALVELGRGAFDVVVTDMRMPGMDGAELLSRVAADQPHATRIVLSGQMEESAAARAATIAHRFLTKPCEPGSIELTIARALELRALLSEERMRRAIGGVEKLPSLPKACVALNRALGDGNVTVEAVARIMEKDVAMAAKVLQLVNSAFFGLPRRVSSVAQAVSYLGLNTMRSLVLSYSVFREFGAGDVGLLEKEQEHSLLCSRIARQLLPDRRAADTASTAALLHDVGTLALVSHLRDDHRVNVERARAEGVGIHRIEAERLGVTHAEVGAYLLGLWGLPHDIIEATLRHHAGWDEVGALDVVAAVQIADAMATRHVYSADDARFHCDPPPPEVIQTLGLAPTLAKIETELLAGLGNGSSP